MKLIIHDLDELKFKRLFPDLPNSFRVVSNDGTIKNCVGCFGCWVKTPVPASFEIIMVIWVNGLQNQMK
jgi:hypothetical protein